MICENKDCGKKAKKGFKHCSRECSPLGGLDDTPIKIVRKDLRCSISIPPLKTEFKVRHPEVSKDPVNGGNYVPVTY